MKLVTKQVPVRTFCSPCPLATINSSLKKRGHILLQGHLHIAYEWGTSFPQYPIKCTCFLPQFTTHLLLPDRCTHPGTKRPPSVQYRARKKITGEKELYDLSASGSNAVLLPLKLRERERERERESPRTCPLFLWEKPSSTRPTTPK